ncbi:MAG: DUF349 domain-containing protein [Bacteroidota bacterium]
MKKEITEKFRALLDADISKEVISELKQLSADFRTEKEKEEKEQLERFLEDPENDKNDFVPAPDALDEEFTALSAEFNEKRRVFAEQRANEERDNLKAKEEIIDSIANITHNEENISKAFTLFNELQEKWKQIGRIPGDKHQDIISAYHSALDNFYYHIRIYKDLKELDLKKNLEHKKEILEKIKQLSEKENTREIEESVKALQNEWFEMGPVPQDSYESLKAEFTEACDAVYARIKEHYSKLKEQLNENLQKKQSILDRARNVTQTMPDNHKNWQKATEKVIALQEEWKTIGFGPKKENEEVWQEFRKQCDLFFSEKKKHYDVLNKEFEINRARKEELCEKAEGLQNNSNWKDTGEKMVKLQQKWKEIGSAGQKHEQKLWTRFRGACNAFFDAKKQHFSGQDEKLQENLKIKQDLLEKIKNTQFGEDKEENLNTIRTLTKEWNSAGHVPRKDMERINAAYQELIDKKFEESNIDKDELEYSKFITRVQSYLSQEDYDFLIRKEKRFLDDKIKELEHQVIQYENNLGFFANSKGADKMLKDVMINLNKAKTGIKRIEEQKKIMSRMQREKEKAAQAESVKAEESEG